MMRTRSRSWWYMMTLVALVVVLTLAAGAVAVAAGKVVVTVGADLMKEERQQMLELFQVDEADVPVIEVTNAEEREYFSGVIPDKEIGTRAISCALVRVRPEGSGIRVQTSHITYVNEQTYANAIITAGVKDADVFAAAPFDVSGTAALTGIFKAFEKASGDELKDEAKSVAAEELVTTADIGKKVGDPEAVAELIKQVKEEVVARGLDNPDAVREVVVRVAGKLGIELTVEQVESVTKLIVQVQKLDLDVDQIRGQLKDFQDRIGLSDEEARGIWEAIKSFFAKLWESIFG